MPASIDSYIMPILANLYSSYFTTPREEVYSQFLADM